MSDMRSTTSAAAMSYFWRTHPPKKIATPVAVSSLEVRVLTNEEKVALRPHYDGDSSVTWYGFYIQGNMVAAQDSLPVLLKRIKAAGYRVYDISTLA
jgi:hypothetical protein